MNVIVLDSNEEFLQYLDLNRLSVVEENKKSSIRKISVTYIFDTLENVENIFKVGNKIWISGVNHMKDCLYVINTPISKDFFKNNHVVFDAEEVLVELNYAPPFTQTELYPGNGFTIGVINGENNVLIDYAFLDFWFGDYFNVGIVQDCLATRIQKVVLKGTMNLMNLLRRIEDETGNVFVTRYEKDVQSNVIHRYLDFLNPTRENNWEWNYKFFFPEDEPDTLNPDDIEIRLTYANNVLQSWDAVSIGINPDENKKDFNIKLQYKGKKLILVVNSKSYNFELTDYPIHAITSQNVDIGDGFETMEMYRQTLNIVLPNKTIFEIYDTENECLLFKHELNPLMGNIQEHVLDVGYNLEDVEFELNEEDTYTAIAPILGGGNNDLGRLELNEVINNWIDLEVTKGSIIPMIVEKITDTKTPTSGANYIGDSVVEGPYWSRPQKPNDNNSEGEGGSYEYFKGTAYWAAPFTKLAGEMYIYDDTAIDIEYSHVRGKADSLDDRGPLQLPKMGYVETSDEDPYAIYNDVAMKLKDKRTPKFDIEVDVANYQNGVFNDYDIHDKVYLKLPGYKALIVAVVSQTTKNIHDITKNTIKLTNYSVNSKVPQVETEILGDAVQFEYPAKGKLNVVFKDIYGNPLEGKLLSFTKYGAGTNTGETATKKTDSQGKASIDMKYDPGTYQLLVQFGGDEEYAAASSTIDVLVTGELPQPTTEETTTTTSTSSSSASVDLTKNNFNSKKKKVWIDADGGSNSMKNSVADLLRAKGWTVHVGGTGPSYHYSDYFNVTSDYAVLITMYNGFDPATIREAYSSRIQKELKRKGVELVIMFDTQTWTGGMKPYRYGDFSGYYSKKAWDDNYSTGDVSISNVATYFKNNNAKYCAYNTADGLVNQFLYGGYFKYKEGTKKTTTTTTTTPKATETSLNWGTPKRSSIPSSVKKQAENVVKTAGAKTAMEAAKAIASWVAAYIGYEYKYNFYQSTSTTLSRKKGNCCCQTDLMLEMWDAVGIPRQFTVKYVHVSTGSTGHVFASLNGTYVDPCKSSSPWNNYVKGYGSPPGHQTTYPTKPF